ncbi:AAA family ATPase [Limnoglobus roseus]|uniref:Histidine kinase n=1 Tax=Limnoglobus roseus TaxID=2598579 RepID=A0A5C1A839_9BACT|nr:AAA family ATPase [Limnoglobus roseus]QEL14665.1 histidine kinase [Limnoglobus roseus]
MTTGMLLGKFLPPHLGHVYLGEFAGRFVDRLTIVVCSLQREPIPGELRFQWMRELFPFDNVVHLTDELPQEPVEHPDFWNLWRSALLRVLPGRPDYVFASEQYGWRLAEELGAAFVPVDGARSAVPVSGTVIRTDPAANWDYLPRCVRPHFVKRVCVFGPESTGKTTLARRLAEHFGTAWVPEYARTLLESIGREVRVKDMERIARGQAASEDALARNATRVLIADTDPLATLVWSDVLFGAVPPAVRELADARAADLYLLTEADVPWVADPVRYRPDGGRDFFERCRAELAARGRRFVVIRGDWDERFRTAVAAVEELLRR